MAYWAACVPEPLTKPALTASEDDLTCLRPPGWGRRPSADRQPTDTRRLCSGVVFQGGGSSPIPVPASHRCDSADKQKPRRNREPGACSVCGSAGNREGPRPGTGVRYCCWLCVGPVGRLQSWESWKPLAAADGPVKVFASAAHRPCLCSAKAVCGLHPADSR